MTDERDTHFQNAAKLLVEKTVATRAMDTVDATRFLSDDDLAELQTLFAQFAYDLTYSAIEFLRYSPNIRPMQLSVTETWVHFIPDLTEWPPNIS